MPASQLGVATPQGELRSLDKLEIIEDKSGNRRKSGLPARYSKGRFLGKGGFAKVYEVQDLETKQIFAAKIVSKAAITKPRAHAKLRSEISIHRSLDHEKVVRFYDYFEDSEHVYIILELCPNQALNEFIRKRPNRRLSESETMFYVYELIVALKYLHGQRVIHRDLKLGNLFLDAESRLKVGDFGLAAQLDHDGEKKRTICGTPNYIAPEILEGKHGHSYEVDVWSLGVIMYTMLVGRPPFETSDVKTTYRRIRYNQYSFPDTVKLSDAAKDLISAILRTDPRSRPSLDEILSSPWFQSSRMPPSMPVTITGYAASPRPIGASARSETPERGGVDFARIDSPAPRCPLRDRSPSVQTPTAQAPNMVQWGQTSAVAAKTNALATNCGGTTTPGRYMPNSGNLSGRPPLAHRGNEENVMPSGNAGSDCIASSVPNVTCAAPSPTSRGFAGTVTAVNSPSRTPNAAAFGNTRFGQQNLSAHQSYTPHPVSMQPTPHQPSHSHQPPTREREASPLLGRSTNAPTKVVAHGYSSSRSAASPRHPLQNSSRTGTSVGPKESQSARRLGQGVGGAADSTGSLGSLGARTASSVIRGTAVQPVLSRRPNTAPCDSPRTGRTQAWESDGARTPAVTPLQPMQERRVIPVSVQSARGKERSSSSPALMQDADPATPACPTSAVGKALDSATRGLPSCRSVQGAMSPMDPNLAACLGVAPTSREVSVSPTALPEIWVTKWVDYSSKYGVGYTLSDGSIGVYFNDSTKIILNQSSDRFDYITRRTQENPEVRTEHTFDNFPDDLKKKVTLLRHFRNYMQTDSLDKKDGASVGSSGLPAPIPKAAPSSSSQDAAGQSPYVKKWTRNKHAIMFQLSNKIVQVVFFDKTETVLSSRLHMVTYIDKKGQVCSYPLSSVHDVPSPELSKRLRYTKDILVNMLGARGSEMGGA